MVYVRPDYLKENTDLVRRMIGAIVKRRHLDRSSLPKPTW